MPKELDKKIKNDHHILKPFHKILNHIAARPEVHRIMPGPIINSSSARSSHNNKTPRITISYATQTGLSCLMKYGSTTQKLRITCETADQEQLTQHISQLFDKLKD